MYNVLPFGLCCTPLVFSKMVRPLVEYFRTMGLRIMLYLDDFLIVSASLQLAIEDRDKVLEVEVAMS